MQCVSTLNIFKYRAISKHFIGNIIFTNLLPTVPIFSHSSLLLLHIRRNISELLFSKQSRS